MYLATLLEARSKSIKATHKSDLSSNAEEEIITYKHSKKLCSSASQKLKKKKFTNLLDSCPPRFNMEKSIHYLI